MSLAGHPQQRGVGPLQLQFGLHRLNFLHQSLGHPRLGQVHPDADVSVTVLTDCALQSERPKVHFSILENDFRCNKFMTVLQSFLSKSRHYIWKSVFKRFHQVKDQSWKDVWLNVRMFFPDHLMHIRTNCLLVSSGRLVRLMLGTSARLTPAELSPSQQERTRSTRSPSTPTGRFCTPPPGTPSESGIWEGQWSAAACLLKYWENSCGL